MLYEKRFLLGDVTVDGAHHTLTMQDGSEIRLEPRLIRLLARLAAAKGEPVLRDTLLAEVSSLPYTGDEALTQSISKLRQALGDTAKAPRFIKTIPRKGYALVAPVSLIGEGGGDSKVPVKADTRVEVLPPVNAVASHKNQTALTVLAVAILLLSGLLVWTAMNPREIVRETELFLEEDPEIINEGDQEFIEKGRQEFHEKEKSDPTP